MSTKLGGLFPFTKDFLVCVKFSPENAGLERSIWVFRMNFLANPVSVHIGGSSLLTSTGFASWDGGNASALVGSHRPQSC